MQKAYVSRMQKYDLLKFFTDQREQIIENYHSTCQKFIKIQYSFEGFFEFIFHIQ